MSESLGALCERAARHALMKYPGPVGEYLNYELQTVASEFRWLAPAHHMRRLCEAVLAEVDPEPLPMPTWTKWIYWAKTA